MHTNIDEGAERRNVGYHPFQDHAGFEILQLLDALFEHCGFEGRAWIAAGFFQLTQNVSHSRQTKGVIDEALRLDLAHNIRIAEHRLDVAFDRDQNLAHDGIGLQVNAGSIERIVAPSYAEEASALLERLRAKPRHLLQRL